MGTEEVRALLANPYTWLSLGLAAIIGVWWAQMTPVTSNLTLVIGISSLMVTAWLNPWTVGQTLFIRILCVVVTGSVLGVLAYSTLWVRRDNSPPIAVTKIVVEPPPYEVGKPLRVKIEVKCTISGLRLRGRCHTFTGVADDLALSPEKRALNEKRIWEQYERESKAKTPISLNAIAGLMTVPIDGPLLTREDVEYLNGPIGVIYVVGQIDFGKGTLDYCGFIRTAEITADEGRATLCIEHNGPSSKAVF